MSQVSEDAPAKTITATTTTTVTTSVARTTTTSSDSCAPSATSSANSSFDVVDTASPSGSQQRSMKSQDPNALRYGRCKWFNVAKGWGFITPDDGGQEVFVHQSVIQMSGFRSLGEQEEVEFEARQTQRGLEATRVSGHNSTDCHGSTYRPRGASNRGSSTTKKKRRRIRCYNCGEFSNHIAAKCQLGPQPKRCHFCKDTDHLLVECPARQPPPS